MARSVFRVHAVPEIIFDLIKPKVIVPMLTSKM